jgi:hypothetical protein
MEKGDIKNFLDAFTGSIEKEEVELYKKILDNGIDKKIETPEDFFFSVLYPFKKFTSGLISAEISTNRDVEFLLMNSQFIEHNFENLFTKFEGRQSCADKSSTIMRKLFTFFVIGERIEFDYNGKYTFHLPKKIFKTHDDIVNFYQALKNLYYGDGTKYMEEMLKIVKQYNESN